MKSIMFTVVVVGLLSITVSAAEHPSFAVASGEKATTVEVVRCHFEEGRIVVRVGDRLHVLHKGDRLEDVGLKTIAVETDSATLTIREDGPAGSLRIVRITSPDGGAVRIQELSTDPNAIRSGDGAPKAAIGHHRIDPPERRSEKH